MHHHAIAASETIHIFKPNKQFLSVVYQDIDQFIAFFEGDSDVRIKVLHYLGEKLQTWNK
ncbi:hypothetical protein DC345_19080 [Paenibacillus taichungensis]|uniref:Uncharacterized protein n=1 Tax=Paenibacillus taichungensis TaxID=484184 RepID=A0A329QMA1_9BACL|nr:hypothetical protein DC345_19080 [Paenibacillus taichungensis]